MHLIFFLKLSRKEVQSYSSKTIKFCSGWLWPFKGLCMAGLWGIRSLSWIWSWTFRALEIWEMTLLCSEEFTHQSCLSSGELQRDEMKYKLFFSDYIFFSFIRTVWSCDHKYFCLSYIKGFFFYLKESHCQSEKIKRFFFFTFGRWK